MPLGAMEIVLGPNAEAALLSLDRSNEKTAASVARRVRALRGILLADCLHGEVVPKDRIPSVLQEAHGLENLYVEDLPSFWRLLYTIVRDEGKRYIVVVEIANHKTYSRWFPGRGH